MTDHDAGAMGFRDDDDFQQYLKTHAAMAAPQGVEALAERDSSKPAEQQGLFRKFDVRRTDGSDGPGGKHEGCEYFVLDVRHDAHARAALAAYADACEVTHPALAADMRARYSLSAVPAAQGVALIERLSEGLPLIGENEDVWCMVRGHDLRAAVAALSAAPAPPVHPEPVAKVVEQEFEYPWRTRIAPFNLSVFQCQKFLPVGTLLYTHPLAPVQPEPEQRPPYSPAQLRRVARDIHAEELKPRLLTLSRAAHLLEAAADWIDLSSAHQQSMGHQAGPSGSTHAAEAGSSHTKGTP